MSRRADRKTLPAIAISMGDPMGIGPEIIAAALTPLRKLCRPLVIGDPTIMARALELKASTIPINIAGGLAVQAPRLDGWEEAVTGKHAQAACLAMASVRSAVLACSMGLAEAMVTAPINKARLAKAGYPYAGHTGYLASLTACREYLMMLTGGPLRVALATTHLPLREVATRLDKKRIISALRLASDGLKQSFAISKPCLAVLGLNPHAGDSGSLGDEESKIILPAIVSAKRRGIDARGPFPADAFFRRANEMSRYDAVLAMYHDQGLIAVKMLAKNNGVNLTLGLPIVRTSPDHGTADDIAWRGIADHGSFLAAVESAIEIVRCRHGKRSRRERQHDKAKRTK
jgi:4-hydroxythreonine-4-phosphate dehydrogenase